MNENLKLIGWLTNHGDLVPLSNKSTDPKAQWKPLYVDNNYTGTDHLTPSALTVKTRIDAIRKEYE